MANIDEGAVLGGRYEIIERVMASSQQDEVLTGRDQVLNRQVLILVASRDNASQAAQSARQLATGERASSIQILDLGLSDDRTYLVAPGNSDVEDLLALLTTENVYVEPFFTETLGSELFGETRSRTPETFDDDAEYYAELQDDLDGADEDTTKRPEFLNRISDRIDDWLEEEDDESPVVPGQRGYTAPAAGAAAAAGNKRNDTQDVPEQPQRERSDQQDQQDRQDEQDQDVATDRQDQVPPAEEPVADEATEAPAPDEPAAEDQTQIVEPVSDDDATQVVPPIATDQEQAPPPEAQEPAEPRDEESGGPVPVAPPPPRGEPTADEGYAIQYTEEPQRSAMGRWLAGLLLVAVLVGAVVISFQFLGSPAEDEDPPVAEEPTQEAPAEDEEDTEEDEEEEEPEPDAPDPVPASVERVVPESPGLSSEYDSDLPAIVDGNQATAWQTLTFTTPQFGGFASNMALVVELEEQAPISEVTIHQNQGSGGAFSVAVSNDPDPEDGVMLTEGSFTGPEYTADAHDDDGEPIEARYVIINFTELPTLSNTSSPDRPYGLRIAEIEVE